MKYTVHGPFQLPRDEDGLFSRDAKAKSEFWDIIDEIEPDLSYGVGVYLISVRNVIWYVGMAQKQTFRQECFASHKVTKIDSAIRKGAGHAHIHLLSKRTPMERLSSPGINGHKDIEFLETSIIGIALERNPDLLNKSDTAILKEIEVPGLYNSPPYSAKLKSVQTMQKILGI